ncbi:MAG: histidine kinase [Sphingobacteriaceae bacterium]|nr:histidine kinase [Cytophagaceae bacterium]
MQRLFSHEFIFSNEPRFRYLRHGVFWAGWILFSTLIYLPVNLRAPDVLWQNTLMLTFSESIVFTLFSHMVFTYLLAYWLLPRYFYKKRFGLLVVGFLAITFLSTTASYLAGELIGRPLRTQLGFPYRTSQFWYGLLAGVRGGMTVGGFFVAIVLVKNLFLQQEVLLKTQQEKLAAELEALKAQVHPHFLFNTLNNLYALTRRQAPEAPDVVLKLSNLLRYVLYECNAPEVPLNQEIQFLKNYVALEQLRYGERLEVSLNFTGNIHAQRIAPLLLIPFLENAFKHGTSEQLDQAWVSLNLAVEGHTLTFQLLNSRDPEATEALLAGGIGLQNVRRRLELLYPDRYDLQVLPEEDTFLVNLRLILPENSEIDSKSRTVIPNQLERA